MLPSKDALQREIIKINPRVPSPDFIKTYKDITRTAGYMRYYNFHPQVFESMFNIAYQKYFSNERYNRKYLFDIVRLYYKKSPKKYMFSKELYEKVLLFFKGAMLGDNFNAKMLARALVKDRLLPDEFIDWLIQNYDLTEELTTTLLRYPKRNKKIEEWVNEVFENEYLRSRRSELIAIKLNQDNSFELSAKTIFADIEYYVQEDVIGYKKFINDAIEDFEEIYTDSGVRHNSYDKFRQQILYYKSYQGGIPKLDTSVFDRSTVMEQINEIQNFLSFYEIDSFFKEFRYRYINYRIYDAHDIGNLLIDEIISKMYFHHKHEIAKRMIYGIYYSKLPLRTKEKRIKEYATEKTYYLIQTMAVKLKSVRLLEWLQQDEIQLFPVLTFKFK